MPQRSLGSRASSPPPVSFHCCTSATRRMCRSIRFVHSTWSPDCNVPVAVHCAPCTSCCTDIPSPHCTSIPCSYCRCPRSRLSASGFFIVGDTANLVSDFGLFGCGCSSRRGLVLVLCGISRCSKPERCNWETPERGVHAASMSMVRCGGGAVSAHHSVSTLRRRKRRAPICHQRQRHLAAFMSCIVPAKHPFFALVFCA